MNKAQQSHRQSWLTKLWKYLQELWGLRRGYRDEPLELIDEAIVEKITTQEEEKLEGLATDIDQEVALSVRDIEKVTLDLLAQRHSKTSSLESEVHHLRGEMVKMTTEMQELKSLLVAVLATKGDQTG
jgi:hypothetical protein